MPRGDDDHVGRRFRFPAASRSRTFLALEIGTRVADDCGHYPDIDTVAPAGGRRAIYTRRDGTP